MMINTFLFLWSLISPFIIYQPVICSYYGGERFNGNLTASGSVFNDTLMIVAHKYLPLGTIISLRNLDGVYQRARVEDKGPFNKRDFDLATRVFSNLADLSLGVVELEYKIVGYDTSGLRWNLCQKW